MDTTRLSIASIEGIGANRKAGLEDAGVHFVCDLLLASPTALSAATNLSMIRIESWRTAALFLELDCMNAQWAEALVYKKVFDLEQLGEMSLEKLNSLFSQAAEENIIHEVPDTETLSTMKVEATRHHFSAQLQGIVVDDAGDPIADVLISCGFREVTSNAKGFWKMTGLSFTGSPSIFASKEGYITHYTERALMDVDVWSTDLLTLQMAPGNSTPLTWDEYLGDKLPSLVTFKAKQIILRFDELRSRDIIKVTETYKNGDIKLISIFRSMTNHQLNIHCYRMLPNLFGEDPVIGSYWCKRSTGLQPLGLGDESVLMLKRLHNKPPPVIDPSAPWTQIFESNNLYL